jgi:hypothetical protein
MDSATLPAPRRLSKEPLGVRVKTVHAALDLGRGGTELEADLAGASVGLEVEDAAKEPALASGCGRLRAFRQGATQHNAERSGGA